MTTSTAESPSAAVSQLLAPSLASPALAFALQTRAQGVPPLARLSEVGQRLLVRQLTRELDGLLSIDVTTLVENAWTTHTDLVAAGYRTAADNGHETVQVGPHTITSTHRPTVDIILNGQLETTVHFQISLTLKVHALVVSVDAGYLTAIQPGACECTAALACEGVPLPSATGRLTLPGRVDLGRRLPLVPDSRLSTARPPAARAASSPPV